MLLRQWTILKLVPRHPRYIDAPALAARLISDEGIRTTTDLTRRDLGWLSSLFPLQEDDTRTPHRWSWPEDAAPITLPGIEPRVALAILLVDTYLGAALPTELRKGLAPFMAAARAAVSEDATKLGAWFKSIRVISRHLPLVPPRTNEEVLDAISTGLFDGRPVEVEYQGVRDDAPRPRVLHPHGLVLRDAAVYAVGLLDDDDAPKLLAMHRATGARVLKGRRRKANVDLDEMIAGGRFGFPLAAEPIELQLRFAPEVARSIRETPLADDQRMEQLPDGSMLVWVRVPDTQQLRSWILGYGSNVEVRAPAALRRWLFETSGAVRCAHDG